ncbi:MAG: DUF3515 domain-containing protein [Mycobacterium sp.]
MGTDPAAPDEDSAPDGPPRAILITALVLAVAAVAIVLGIAATRRTPETPVAIAAVPAPQAASADCRALVAALPDHLGEFGRVRTIEPTPAGTAAWRAGPDGEPVILRCGLDRPGEFVLGSPIQLVDSVQWFQLADPDTRRSTWVSVDRAVYVAVTLPMDSGPTPIQTISDLIARALPAVPIRPGPPR